ncbi:MAG: Rieske 2Fe-2S domain-containing protein [Pseudomonadota bacterium]
MARHELGALSAFPRDAVSAVDIDGTRALLVRYGDDEVRVFAPRCPHQGADLACAQVTARTQSERAHELAVAPGAPVVRCPWHGFEFALTTGEALVSAPEGWRWRLRFYAASVEDGQVVVMRPERQRG